MRPAGAAALAVAIVAVVGCGESTSAADDGTEVASASGQVTVTDAWTRPTPPVSNVGAFYLTIRNDGETADVVIGATSPRCEQIEIHQTTTVDGVASMGLADRADLAVGAGSELVFEPSGLHVMCLGLDEPVVAGEQLSLTVELDRAGAVTVEAVAENR